MGPHHSSSPTSKNNDELTPIQFNRRNHIRYIVKEFSAGASGSVIDISFGGMRIKKARSEEISDSQLTCLLLKHEIKADIVWQDKNDIGLRFVDEPDVVHLIKALTKRIHELEIKPKAKIQDNIIASDAKEDVLGFCINLMAELENIDTDITQLKRRIQEIRDLRREMPDHVPHDSPGEINESGSNEPEGLAKVLIDAANAARAHDESNICDLDFAIARLGRDSVKKISIDFLRKKISTAEVSLPGFDNYQSYNILKIVTFKHLAHFFGFKDEQGEGRLLLSLETKGIDILTGLGGAASKDLKDYYVSSPRIYSELSRILEKNNFGKDLLFINKSYFKNKMKMSQDLYDGYVLAHLILNPSYTIDSTIKLRIAKRGLMFSFLAYLTFIATQFILDRDRESGIVLMNLLRGAGMDQRKIMDFISNTVGEANDVLKDLGLSGTIRSGSLPQSSFKIEGYLQKNIHIKYLIKSFKDFSGMKRVNRMAVRYEDNAYTHFILRKLVIADDIGLHTKALCVIPCKNIAEDALYVEDFSYFDLVIFKDIDRLPLSLMKAFVKLWNSFEGKIIATFNNLTFLDFDNEKLYMLLKNHIVDFPSYFSNREIYERMIDHTLGYIKPYMGNRGFDKARYLSDFISMDTIKTNEMQSYP